MPTAHDAFKHAINTGNAAALRDLLQAEPELREQINQPMSFFGARPINVAARHQDVLDVLIDFGADINLRSDWSEGPFGVLDACDEATARHLLTRGAILTPHAAARLGWMDELRQLLDEKPSAVHARGGDGKRPLHDAKTPAIAQLLLERGADIDARCTDHLSTAAQYLLKDHPDVTRYLLERGTTPDIYLAAHLGDVDLATTQINERPDVLGHRIGRDGYNRASTFTIYNWMLGFFKSPLTVAKEAGHDDVAKLMWDRADRRTRLLDAAWRGDELAARDQLEAEPDLLKKLGADQRLLADACHHGKVEAAALMLSLGFDPAALGIDGGTALHQACWIGNAALVETVLADPRTLAVLNQPDTSHASVPIGWAVHGSQFSHHAKTGAYVAVIEQLHAAGAAFPQPGSTWARKMLQWCEGRPDVHATLTRLISG